MRKYTTIPVLMLAAAWLLGGCSSDTTAPKDSLPPLSNSDVAGQAGYLAVAMINVAPLVLDFDGGKAPAQGEYTFTFTPGDPVQGTVNLEFRDGGPTGTLVHHSLADWARAYTAAGAALTVEFIAGGVPWVLTFDLASDVDRINDTATVDGGGQLVVGNYTASWSVDGLVVYSSDTTTWPSGGTMSFTNEGITAVVVFDGDHTATVTVGDDVYTLNLENGSLEPVGGSS